MKHNALILILPVILLSVCATHKNKVIFYPNPAQDSTQEQAGLFESWQIIESENGFGETGIPVWIRLYLDKKIREIELLDEYRGKYVFVGENRGSNFNTLRQWSNGFTAAQDLPRLVAQRVEQRFVAAASLYPDDEYGEYFANMIKKVSDEEYPGAVKEQTFWIKRQRLPVEAEEDADFPEIQQTDTDIERYEFFVVISIDKEILQKKIQEIMADIKTNTAPRKEQTAATNKLRAVFFEGF